MPKTRRSARTPTALALAVTAALFTGCASNHPAAREHLASAYHELENATPNYLTILGAADAYLTEQPTGPAAADALYLRGRALEAKGQRDPASPQKDFADAYAYYTQALARQPRPALEALVRVGLGNVLYFQDRYANAANELAAAIPNLERDDDKAWALYRIGLCQQRVGQWDAADATFSTVQQTFPNTEQARRAREHQGARAFYVQVGAYQNPAVADSALSDLKRQGMPAQKFAEVGGQNMQFVRVGPFATYDSAQQTRQRVWAKYPGALVIP